MGYARISKDDDLLGAGVARQQEDIAAHAKRLGAELVAVYVDNDTSASKRRGQNTAWAKMFREMPTLRPEYLIAWKDDRLDRNLTDSEPRPTPFPRARDMSPAC